MSVQDEQGQGTDVQTGRVSVQDEHRQGADVQTGKVSAQDEQGQGADIQTGRVSVQDEQSQGADVQTGKGLFTLMCNHISEVILSTCGPKNEVFLAYCSRHACSLATQ